jgi:hypothetical protein
VGKTYKLDDYRAECDIEPFVLDTGEMEIVIPAPTGESLLMIAETPISDGRRLLRLIAGDQFEPVWELVKKEQGTVLVKLLQDLGKHFMVATVSEAPGGSGASPS